MNSGTGQGAVSRRNRWGRKHCTGGRVGTAGGEQLIEKAVHGENEVHEEVHGEVLEPRTDGCYACLLRPARRDEQILSLDRSQTASAPLVPVTTADNAEQRCCECHEEEGLRVEVVDHEGSASQHRRRYEEVENEGVFAGRLFSSIHKWP